MTPSTGSNTEISLQPERDSGLVIRTMSASDLGTVLAWAAEEGWNPGLCDADSFYAADPAGFLIAEKNGQPVGCISAVRYCAEFGFLGLYIVRPDFRGLGYGMALWNHGMKYLAGCNIGLDGVAAQQANYAKSGFRLAHKNIRYELHSSAVSGFKGAANSVAMVSDFVGERPLILRNLADIDFELVAAYDQKMFGCDRRSFLQKWIRQPGAAALGALDPTGALLGYSVIRPCGAGNKIGPLFAETEEIARALFTACVEKAAPGPVYLDVPEPHFAAMKMARDFGMEPTFETARMYSQADPHLPLEQIFGISSFELG